MGLLLLCSCLSELFEFDAPHFGKFTAWVFSLSMFVVFQPDDVKKRFYNNVTVKTTLPFKGGHNQPNVRFKTERLSFSLFLLLLYFVCAHILAEECPHLRFFCLRRARNFVFVRVSFFLEIGVLRI